MLIEELVYKSDSDDPNYDQKKRDSETDEDSNSEGLWVEESDESESGEDDDINVDKNGDARDGGENRDDGDDAGYVGGDDGSDEEENEVVEVVNEERGTKKKRNEDEDTQDIQTKRKRAKKAKDEDEDIMERFEYEAEESVVDWFDEFMIHRNTIPDSSDEDEDPIITRDRRIRLGTYDRLAIGRTFFTGFEFKEKVLHHALKNRENIKQDMWGKEKLRFVCAQEKDCGWVAYCSYDNKQQMWVLKTRNRYHSCTSNGKCKLLKSPVIGKLFMDKLRMKPNYMPVDIQEHIKEQWQIMSTIGQCQRGRLLALKWLDEEYALQFAHLRGYIAEIKKRNPESTAIVEIIPNDDGEDVFNRFYLCLGALKNSFYYCRPIIGIDGTFLKHADKGCLLTAIAHDANNQIYPVAWAAVQTENADNWLWFLNLLKGDLNLKDGKDYIIISYRSKGIISAVQSELPNAEHRMCVKHIVENLKKRHANKDLLKGLVWPLAWSYNQAVFEANLNKIRAYSMSLYDDVMKEEPKTWSRAYYRIEGCCEDVDNNATESFNSTIVKARAKALVPMLETIRRQAMARISKRKKKITKWKKRLSEYASEILELENEDAKKCQITKGTHGRFEVYLDGNSHFVNLTINKWECSCGKWQITGIPCQHAYGAIIDVNKDVEDYVSPYFNTEVWKEQYETGPSPVSGPLFWMNDSYGLITKPPPPKTPGRKKGQKNQKNFPRIKSLLESPNGKKGKKGNKGKNGKMGKKGKKEENEEKENKTLKLGRNGRIIHCKMCKEAGHNAAGCKKFPKEKKNKKNKKTKEQLADEGGTSQRLDTITLSQGAETVRLSQGPETFTQGSSQ